MAKTRMISTDFWSDTWIDGLDPIEKLLYIYCFTNDKSSWCGATEIPLKKIGYETGIDRDMVLKILKRFEEDKKVLYYEGYLIVVNFIRRHFNGMNSPDKWSKNNQLKAIEDDILKLPDNVYTKCYEFVYGFNAICNQENKGLARGLQGACKGVVPSPLPSSSSIPLSSPFVKDTPPSKFIKPKLEEVKQYCIDRKNNIDAQGFIDFYESNGRMVGKNKMKDRKACIRTRESRNKNDPKKETKEYQKKDARENFTFM